MAAINDNPIACDLPGADVSVAPSLIRLPPDEVRSLSELNPYVPLLHFVVEWVLILGAASLATAWPHPLVYVLAVMFIGGRQHALLALLHDGLHYRLFGHRKLNEWSAELLTWPFMLLSMTKFRRTHFAHHRRPNTKHDPDWLRKQNPDWVFPKSWWSLSKLLAIQLVGLGFVRLILQSHALKTDRATETDHTAQNRAPQIERRSRLSGYARLAFNVCVLAWCWQEELLLEYVLLWIVPFLTWTQLIIHIRSIGEHFAIKPGAYGETRTTMVSWLERVFIIPKNLNFHLEHHLYPSVPFYRLPALHQRLMRDSQYPRVAHITSGYWRVLRECTTV